MAESVNHKVFAKPHNGTGLLVKVIDRSHQIAPTVPVGKHKLTTCRLLAIAEHLIGLVSQWKDSPCILALAVPDANVAEARTSQRVKHHVSPRETECLSNAQSRFKHQQSNVRKWLRTSCKVDFLLLP